MRTQHIIRALAMAAVCAPLVAEAQDAGVPEAGAFIYGARASTAAQGMVFAGPSFEILESSSLDGGRVVKDAPFSAEAITEFTQTLGDGNRIERSFRASIARDGQGRTRREEQVALLGPLAGSGDPPTLVTLSDPAAGLHYTLDDKLKIARRDRVFTAKVEALPKLVRPELPKLEALPPNVVPPDVLTDKRWEARVDAGGPATFTMATPVGNAAIGGAFFVGDVLQQKAVVEQLGSRTIEGVRTEGTRSTTTIPAGAIGNQLPIEVVTERWFSNELQVPVLITRRDPRSGDTTYRLTNIVRAEPPQDLFTVPRDYRVEDLSERVFKIREKIEREKIAPKAKE